MTIMNRTQFLATPVRDLVDIRPNGDVVCAEKPPRTSEDTYRDHLASGPRVHVYVRQEGTQGLPANLWGGTLNRNCEPFTAGVIARSELRRGCIVTSWWAGDPLTGDAALIARYHPMED